MREYASVCIARVEISSDRSQMLEKQVIVGFLAAGVVDDFKEGTAAHDVIVQGVVKGADDPRVSEEDVTLTATSAENSTSYVEALVTNDVFQEASVVADMVYNNLKAAFSSAEAAEALFDGDDGDGLVDVLDAPQVDQRTKIVDMSPPSPPPPDDDASGDDDGGDSDDGGLSTGAIVGIVIGSVGFVGLVAAGAVLYGAYNSKKVCILCSLCSPLRSSAEGPRVPRPAVICRTSS